MGIFDELTSEEWVSLPSPFLAKDDPHQRCVAVQRETGRQFCNCSLSSGECTQECCVPRSDWVI